MPIKLVVAVTDRGWFDHLRRRPDLAEVNFWAPSDVPFRALQPGELFLFKLRAPVDRIVGGGVFAYATTLPCSLAWEAFGEANGAASLPAMRARIAGLRRDRAGSREDFAIGCRILTQPFFLPEDAWLPVPGWARNIVSFRTYTTDDRDGLLLWDAVQGALRRATPETTPGMMDRPRYGEPVLVKPRLGQGAFRVLVTDIYRRRCAVTGERTLPALDAAHIRPYGEGGEHAAPNGLLLRRDIPHCLTETATRR
jgi:putative restriction endonuclease